MLLIRTRVRYRGAIAALMKKREFNNSVLKPAWGDVGEYWKSYLWAKHFTPEGAREYRYTPRRGERMARGSKNYRRSYTGRKEKKFGHRNPLEWIGELKRLSRIQDVKPSMKGVKVLMKQARKANLRPKKGRINMAEELRTISRGEKPRLEAELKIGAEKRLNRSRASHTQTIS